jgi:hypothetical protein
MARTTLLRLTARMEHHAWRQVFDDLPVDGMLLESLLGNEHGHARLLVEITRCLQLTGPDALPALPAADLHMMSGSASQWRHWLIASGLACWARAIGGEIRGDKLRALDERFGQDVVAQALLWRGAAAIGEWPDDLDAFAQEVRSAGNACFSAWRAELPDGWRPWLDLVQPKAPDACKVPACCDGHGAAILRCMARGDGLAA